MGYVGVYDAGQGVDWNCLGSINSGTVIFDINNDRATNTLHGNDDWGHIRLKVGLIGAAGATLPRFTEFSEATPEIVALTPPLPPSPALALADAIRLALGDGPEAKAFLAQAESIASAPNANAKAGKLQAFIDHVNAQTGKKALTPAQAATLIGLARLL